MRIGVIGQGYVGKTFSERAIISGHNVIGIDNNLRKISNNKNSKYPIFADYGPVSECEIIVIAVPTPLDSGGKPDLSILTKVCMDIKSVLKPGTLIVNESTSHPGTLRNVVSRILGEDFLYATAPERIDPGNKYWDISNTPRVVGALSESAKNLAKNLYETICEEVYIVDSPEIAEASKLLENAYRLINITLINQLSLLFDDLDISLIDTVKAAKTKPFGFMPFLPSIGIGGHCIPIDPVYLSYMSTNNSNKVSLIEKSIEFNQNLPRFWAERIFRRLENDASKLVQVIGISYKGGVNDIRESASVSLILELRKLGLTVIWHDELVNYWNGEYSSPLLNVDLGVITVRHPGVNYQTWENNNVKVLDLSPELNNDLTN
jgi:UDP-N-acetyl-D-glucosamine dehydrogenase